MSLSVQISDYFVLSTSQIFLLSFFSISQGKKFGGLANMP
jgi:hypothetical protein